MSAHFHETVAVYGGTFDPPHLGHREAVRGLFEVPSVKQVIVIPSATPPHKTSQTAPAHRLAMAQIGFLSTLADPIRGDVTVSDIEIRRASETGQPSYSFDTLTELRRQYSSLAFVIGADQLQELPQWHRFPELLDVCHWIVLTRKPKGEDVASEVIRQWLGSGLLGSKVPFENGLGAWKTRKGATFLALVPTQARAASSTAIRESLARTGNPPETLLLPEVLAYLKQNRLYGSKES